jgi:gliding motility-associated-like protein
MKCLFYTRNLSEMRIRLAGIVFIFLCNNAKAQLCSGSLGDPIINITFGQGTNPGGPLSAATTSYQYVTNDCPNDGFYTVRNNTNACFGNSWHNVASDHTGNAGGYFMLVNAAFATGTFYVDTVKGLCENTSYEFAAWMMNVLLPSACSGSGIQPNITLQLEKPDGTLLMSITTGNIASTSVPIWKQYGAYFISPVGNTDVVIKMFNNAPGGCGNDLALDDITFRPCGPLITGIVDGAPIYAASYCEGPARQFQLNCTVSGGFASPEFQWQRRNSSNPTWTDIPGATSNNYLAIFPANASPGIYEYRLAVTESGNINSTSCRIYSQDFAITIHPNPVTTAVNNGPVCLGKTLSLSATGGNQYIWSGPNGFTATGTPGTISNAQLNHGGKYYVDVFTAAGCTKKDSTVVIVNPVPTATTSFSSDSLCIGDNIQLNANGGDEYRWFPSTGLSNPEIPNPIASPSVTTIYNVVVSNSFSCSDTATTTIYIMPDPVANAGPDKVIFEGQSVQLSGDLAGQLNNFSWSPATYINDINSLIPVVNPPVDQNYTLTVVSTYGCGTVSDDVMIKVYKDIFIPTAFTPNNDGLNDTWHILGLEALKTYRVMVFNRWGEIVFQIKDEARPWNGIYKGIPLPPGVYVYLVEKGTERLPVKGTVMLIR